MTKYKNIAVKEENIEFFAKAEELYREDRPELDETYLSMNKILYEVFKHYFKGTRFKLQ